MPSIQCITKLDGTTTDDAENLDLIMPMCNLLEYSLNYSNMPDTLPFYSKDEEANFNVDITDTNAVTSFKYKA